MARTVYTAVGKPYRGVINKLRTDLDKIHDFLLHSPGAKDEVAQTLLQFIAQQDIAATGFAVVTTGTSVPATGTNVTGGATAALTISDGQVIGAVITGQGV